MQKGNIAVQAENIFPIIKKFLYTEHEIFLRELVSNAVDACQKLTTLSNRGEVKGEVGDIQVRLEIDKENKVLKIIDSGIGMTEEEVNKYINQIAFSSANDFLEKYKDEANIIGHFGLGFYSSFMVSEKVEIRTKSYQEGAQAVSWTCSGDPEFTLENIEKEERGTEVWLYLDEDSQEYLNENRVQELLDKFCKFLPIPIIFGEETIKDEKEKETTTPKQINNTSPAWVKMPTDLKEEDYLAFYKELYPFSEEPLFWIHLNVDYPFNLTGILYFPKITEGIQLQKNKIQLYSNQVFVTDQVEEIVPEWLTLLHGVIDSPDIPLNVSRSYLQGDQNVKKITGHISSKVAKKLEELFKKDRAEFENKWDSVGLFVKYGMISDEKFYEKIHPSCLYKLTDGSFKTFDELKAEIEKEQTDKSGQIVLLYTNDKDNQYLYVQAAIEKGYKVVHFDSMIDTHFVNQMEHKLTVKFIRVDSDTVDKLIEKDEEEMVEVLTEKEREKLSGLFKEITKEDKIEVNLKPLSIDTNPVVLVQPEFGRRMQEMAMMSGGQTMPEFHNLVVNSNHPVMSKILKMKSAEKRQNHIQHLYDLALLSQNKLKGEAMSSFLRRSIEILD